MSELRPYQRAAVDAVWRYFAAGNRGAPMVVLPTGSGKSHVIAELATEVIARFPDTYVVVVTHRSKIVSQNANKLYQVSHTPIGIYSAGLRSKRVARITVANIQSIYNKARQIPKIGLLIIDEAHLVPDEGQGQYRTFINELRAQNENLLIVGFTATPFRLKQGVITEGEGRIFTDIVCDVSVTSLLDQGFLSPLIGKGARASVDTSEIRVANGEYVMASAETVIDRITEAACQEMITLGHARKSWLVFCSGVEHSEHVAQALARLGVKAEVILGNMDEAARERIIHRFEKGDVRALVSCDVLTTGFDSPQVDMIALLRPTQSTSLYIQMLGRGMRLAPGKTNCMVLDFAGNLERHGPIDRIAIGPRGRDGKSELVLAPVKFCPGCNLMLPNQVRVCAECGHEFGEDGPSHGSTATEGEFISTYERPRKFQVSDARYIRHRKKGSKVETFRADYFVGDFGCFSEWVCLEHDGIARKKAEQWWKDHGGFLPVPSNVTEALERENELREPTQVWVRKDGEYERVIGVSYA